MATHTLKQHELVDRVHQLQQDILRTLRAIGNKPNADQLSAALQSQQSIIAVLIGLLIDQQPAMPAPAPQRPTHKPKPQDPGQIPGRGSNLQQLEFQNKMQQTQLFADRISHLLRHGTTTRG